MKNNDKTTNGLTTVQQMIITTLREKSTIDGNPLAAAAHAMSDDEFARWLFRNYRGVGQRQGLRLTDLGLQLMKCYFRPYETVAPAGYTVSAAHILFLDKHTTLPYHFSKEGTVLFELKLGIQLKLADGNIQTLIESAKANQP